MTYKVLSDHEFELLVGDLLGARNDCIFESFTRGPDSGIDLRRVDDSGYLTVVQCKHMEGSSFSKLRSAAKKEAASWTLSKVRPDAYLFATSKGLTPSNKDELNEILQDVASTKVEILGGSDIDSLLRSFPTVQRGHVKLWLSNAEQLRTILHSGIAERSEALLEDLEQELPIYVNTTAFDKARHQLHSNGVIIISGPPGVGKSTTAKVLVADAVTDGFAPVVISADADEADSVFDRLSKQVFYYDDFLGTNILGDRIAKNEDKRLAALIRKCMRSPNHLLVMTTREYILQQALSWYEELNRAGIPLHKYMLELTSYSRYERAQILISHVRHADDIDKRALVSILKQRRYDRIIDHPNYNPRLVEYVTGRSFYQLQPSDTKDYFAFVMTTFGDPNIVWSRAFENQIDDYSRMFVVAIAVADQNAPWNGVHSQYIRMCEIAGFQPFNPRTNEVFRTLEGSFVESRYDRGTVYLQLTNPGLSDLVASWLTWNSSVTELAILSSDAIEPIEWIVDRVAASIANDKTQQRVIALCTDRLVNIWDSIPTRGPYRYQSSDAWTLTRVSLALKLLALHGNDGQYREWVKSRLSEVTPALRVEPFFPLLAAKVVKQAVNCELLVDDLATAIIEKSRSEAQYLDAWECLLQIRDTLPNLFSDNLRAELASDCSEWGTEELSIDVPFFKGVGDIEDILEICVELGAKVDDEIVATAMTQVGEESNFERTLTRESYTMANTVKPADENELIQHLVVEALRQKLDSY